MAYTLTLDLTALRERAEALQAQRIADQDAGKASPEVLAGLAERTGDAYMMLAWATYEQAFDGGGYSPEGLVLAADTYMLAMHAYAAAYILLCENDAPGAFPSDHALLMYARSKSAWLAGEAIEG